MAHALATDLGDPDLCRAAVATAVDVFGGLDLLVNNAAPSRNRAYIGAVEPSDWPVHNQVVLEAAMTLANAARPYLAKSGGSIVNISSTTAGRIAPDNCSWAYHVSKAALEQATRWLAMQFGPSGIRVNAVAPGLVDREFTAGLAANPQARAVIEATVPLGRSGQVIDVANAVAFLASPAAAYITGQVLVVDGGLSMGEVFGMASRTWQRGATPAG
jgi:3-oxoacyl-[acyl-carrier protein] reductase